MRKRVERITITESFAHGKVNAETGYIENVKLVGLKSKKGYDYDPPGLAKSVNLYEDVQIFEDHPDPENPKRKTREAIAIIKNPRFVEDDGIRGDLKVMTSREGGRALMEAASDPDKAKIIGFSHNADPTKIIRKNGRMRVMGISKVHSVDTTPNPATTNGLFESDDMKISVRDVFKKLYPAGKIVKLLEDMEMPLDTSMPGPNVEGYEDDEMEHEEVIYDGFLAMVSAIWSDDKLDMKAKLDKIAEAAKAQEAMISEPEEEKAETKMKEETSEGEGETQEDDEEEESEEEKKKVKESLPITTGKLMESLDKYGLTFKKDRPVIEAAQLLPETKALKLLESYAANHIAEEEEATSTGRKKNPPVLVEDYDTWIKGVKAGSNDPARRLLESVA